MHFSTAPALVPYGLIGREKLRTDKVPLPGSIRRWLFPGLWSSSLFHHLARKPAEAPHIVAPVSENLHA